MLYIAQVAVLLSTNFDEAIDEEVCGVLECNQ